MFALWQRALLCSAGLMRWAGCSASSGARSLANAVVVARTVLEDVDMDVVGMRFVGAWAEHGREPADNPLCAPTRSELRQIF